MKKGEKMQTADKRIDNIDIQIEQRSDVEKGNARMEAYYHALKAKGESRNAGNPAED